MSKPDRIITAAGLLALVEKNPENPSAGSFAQAAAELLAQHDRLEEQAHLRDNTPGMLKILQQMVDSMNRKPAELPAKTAAQSVNQAVARSTAMALVQAATELEQTAALGASRNMGGLSVGSGLTPLLAEPECAKLRERALVYRDRAIAVLTEAGIAELGYPMLAGCA